MSTIGVKTAYMQQVRALKSKNTTQNYPSEPNEQFILDLQAWLQHLQTEGHKIMLCLDNNKDFYSSEGSLYPLRYQLYSHIRDNSHNGSLCTLAITCGLVDILGIQHS